MPRLDWRTAHAITEHAQAHYGLRIHLTGDPSKTGHILGAPFEVIDGEIRIFYTVEWDATGPDRDDQYHYHRYTAAELTPLPTAPERSEQPHGEQLDLFAATTIGDD